ncbi:hypothetical protein AQUCO_01700451v1 [Aquilegia coerulea]|uniref:DUF674 family protein n=1 Tax=Aquilegia coerulea TaxID=218851 RepID=A0A2G5DMZ2_AQUCA|nr:hypothetical protein AQUCO_01700451v1 [Aquilegia coerulea]
MANEKKINIRLLIDKEKNKVLFAESDKDFVDLLFSFLTLPIGTIITLANKETNLGCMDKLYQSVEALDHQYFQTEVCKQMLLLPRSASEDIHPCMFENVKCLCGKIMNSTLELGWNTYFEDDKLNCAFVNGIGKFMITDALEVSTLSAKTSLSILFGFGINDGTTLEVKNISVGLEEVMDLLKQSMLSKTPMTDVFLLKQNEINTEAIIAKPLNVMFQSDTKRVNLDLFVRKSDKKVLYAVAKADFLDFLFSFLTFPMGSVVELFGGSSSIGSIDNIYKSVEGLYHIDPEKLERSKDRLLHPKIASQHGCKNQLLQIEENTGMIYISKCSHCFKNGLVDICCRHGLDRAELSLINPKFIDTVTLKGGGFIRDSMVFMITDELVVELYSQISSISYLNKQCVPFSDLEERSVTVGEQEALSLLKASLTSKTALTSVFCQSSKKRTRG